jgi:hypothetical protein
MEAHMAFYQGSWLILFSPLFSFAVIIFGTRMWDLATRAQVNAAASHEARARIPSADLADTRNRAVIGVIRAPSRPPRLA